MGKKKSRVPGLIEQLRERIRQSGKSLNQLGRACGVDSGRLSRFMTGQRGLSQDALDRIVKTLRLRLVPEGEAEREEE